MVRERFRVGEVDGSGSFGQITDAAVDSRGIIFALDALMHRAYVLSPDGRLLGHFGGSGTGPGEFVDPVAIMTGADDRVHVLDQRGGRIVTFDWHAGAQHVSTRRLAVAPGDACLADGTYYVHVLGLDSLFAVFRQGEREALGGVDPVPWTPDLLGERSPQCQEHIRRTRRSFGSRW